MRILKNCTVWELTGHIEPGDKECYGDETQILVLERGRIKGYACAAAYKGVLVA